MLNRPRAAVTLTVAAAVLLSGCVRNKPQGPDTTAAPGADPTFCAAIKDFRAATAGLTTQTLATNPNEVLAELTTARQRLVQMAAHAPTVPGVDFAADLRTAADNYQGFYSALAAVKGDPQAMTRVANAFSTPATVNKANADLNNYAHTVCGLNTETPQTTTGPGTTVSGSGPTGPVQGPTATTR